MLPVNRLKLMRSVVNKNIFTMSKDKDQFSYCSNMGRSGTKMRFLIIYGKNGSSAAAW